MVLEYFSIQNFVQNHAKKTQLKNGRIHTH